MNHCNQNKDYDFLVDATELKCPMPLLKMKQCLNNINSGDVILLRATDPSSKRDVQTFIDFTEHHLEIFLRDSEYQFFITKA